jgi:hypothetical protein
LFSPQKYLQKSIGSSSNKEMENWKNREKEALKKRDRRKNPPKSLTWG